MITTAESDVLEAALHRYADDAAAALFATDGPDGDIEAIVPLLGSAADMGMWASPCRTDDGHVTGVWGRHVADEGPALSLAALHAVGGACAGLAACIHAQGLGCLALDGADAAAGPVTAAAFMPPNGLPIGSAAGAGPRFADGRLSGSARHVHSGGRPDLYVAVATSTDGPVVAAVPAATPGVLSATVGSRVGLRAVTVSHVTFEDVPVPEAALLRTGADAVRVLTDLVAADWLGAAAIAAGTARSALCAATEYARGRHQGGMAIGQHAAVRQLLAEAATDVAVCEAMLACVDDLSLSRAIHTRLACCDHAARAVTGSVQVLGGYGYMDDYGLSKRLRDVNALAVLHGGADQLRMLASEPS